MRYFMAFCVPFFSFLAIFIWFLERGDESVIWLILGFSTFLGLGAIYALFVFIASFTSVQLDAERVTINGLRASKSVLYNEVSALKTTPFFMTLYTANGRLRIERNIHNFHTLVQDLQHRILVIQQQKERIISDPLPRQFQGEKSNILLFLGLSLLFLLFAIGMVSALLEKQNGLENIFALLTGLFFGGLILLLFHEMLFNLPRVIRFEDDQIILKKYIGQTIYDPQVIDTAHISTVILGKQKRPSYNLTLTFKDNPNRTLEIRDAWFSEHTFQIMDLITHHYHIQPIYKKQAQKIAYTQFANGSKDPFPTYFERESDVPIHSLQEIETWLRQCTYICDHEQFAESDVWVHPVDFEQTRRGDCEDHALWAWRKLVHLNDSAEFVVGYLQNHFGEDGYHAWVTFAENGRIYILETTAKTSTMILPLQTQTKKYRPLFSVDKNFKTYKF